jgi:hypothetical protein
MMILDHEKLDVYYVSLGFWRMGLWLATQKAGRKYFFRNEKMKKDQLYQSRQVSKTSSPMPLISLARASESASV